MLNKEKTKISQISVDAIKKLAGGSLFSLLAQKFLQTSLNERVRRIKAIQERNNRNKLFWIAFATVPIASIIPLFLQINQLADLLNNERFCRLFVATSLNLLACTYMLLLTTFTKAILTIPPIATIVYRLPQAFYILLLGNPDKQLAFTILTFGHSIVPIARLTATLANHLLTILGLNQQKTKENKLNKLYEQAMQQASHATKKDLEDMSKHDMTIEYLLKKIDLIQAGAHTAPENTPSLPD